LVEIWRLFALRPLFHLSNQYSEGLQPTWCPRLQPSSVFLFAETCYKIRVGRSNSCAESFECQSRAIDDLAGRDVARKGTLVPNGVGQRWTLNQTSSAVLQQVSDHCCVRSRMTEVFTPKMLQQAQVNSILSCCHDDPEWLRMEKGRTVEAKLGASHTNLSTPAVRPANW